MLTCLKKPLQSSSLNNSARVSVPEEGWFGQPKYSTHIKTSIRCAGFCLYFLRVSGQDRDKQPAHGNDQIAGFGGFRPLSNLKKNRLSYWVINSYCG